MGIPVCPEDNPQTAPVHGLMPVLNGAISLGGERSPSLQGLPEAELSTLHREKMLVHSQY